MYSNDTWAKCCTGMFPHLLAHQTHQQEKPPSS